MAGTVQTKSRLGKLPDDDLSEIPDYGGPPDEDRPLYDDDIPDYGIEIVPYPGWSEIVSDEGPDQADELSQKAT